MGLSQLNQPEGQVRRISYLLLTLAFTAAFALPALAVPGGPQAVIYYSDGLKLLKSKLYLSNGQLVQSFSTTSTLSWVGGGTSTGQTSLGVPGTGGSIFVHLPSLSATFNSGLGIEGTYSSLISHVKLSAYGVYSSGGYGSTMTFATSDGTTASDILRLNTDKSLQIMQQIATPATPSSGTIKLYAKSDDRLYMLDDGGTERQVIVPDASSWYIKVSLTSTTQPSLGTSNVTSYTELTSTDATLTPASGSAAAGAVCSTTNAATAPSTSPTTCAVGDESMGFNFTPPTTGPYEVCVAGTHRAGLDSNEGALPVFQLVETGTADQTISEEGGTRLDIGARAITIASGASAIYDFPFSFCSILNFTSGASRAVRLMYEQAVINTPNSSELLMDANTNSGQRNLSFTVKRIY